jgi:hypothetical protein
MMDYTNYPNSPPSTPMPWEVSSPPPLPQQHYYSHDPPPSTIPQQQQQSFVKRIFFNKTFFIAVATIFIVVLYIQPKLQSMLPTRFVNPLNGNISTIGAASLSIVAAAFTSLASELM